MVKARKRSVVWGFFKNIDSQSVRCLLCRSYLLKKDHGSTTHMLRHLRVKHPTELSRRSNERGPEAGPSSDDQDMEADGEHFCSVEVALEDDESDSVTTVHNTDISSSINGFMHAPHGGPVEIITHIEASDGRPVRRPRHRSVIWRHFKRLDSMNAVRCCICMTKLVESGGISNLRRHLSTRHPEVYSELLSNQQHPSPSSNFSQDSNTIAETDEAFWATDQSEVPDISGAISVIQENTAASPAHPQRQSKCLRGYVEVVLKDRDSEEVTVLNDTDNGSAIDGIPDASHGGPAEPQMPTEASNNRPAGRTQRSMIWRHFERLDSLNAARCRICMKKLKCGKNSTSNLHRHMSKRHPKMLSEMVSSGLRLPPLNFSQVSHDNETSEQRQAPDELVLKVSEGERRVLRRERELIEALRRTQKEEARTLEHQRELLEKLRAASAREAAAEKEEIRSLRKAQQEEAKDLSKQQEELQKEKAELQKKWKELQQEREELLLFSRGQQVP